MPSLSCSSALAAALLLAVAASAAEDLSGGRIQKLDRAVAHERRELVELVSLGTPSHFSADYDPSNPQ